MNSLEILLLALAMSVDAFMVAFSYGLIIKKNRFLASVKLAISTGLGQFLMPLIGWYGALLIHGYIENIDHWISFLVFVALGVNVIIEAFSPDEHKKLAKKLTGKILLMIGIATSIDAMVAGITLYFMTINILYIAAIIGITTFLCTLMGFYLNCCFKKLPEKYLASFAGMILIGLGFKVLFEHLAD